MKLLLHVCCAPCSTHAIETVMKDYEVTLLFSNSNISPKEEYDKRLEQARKIAKIYKLKLIEDDYNHEAWLKYIKGFEQEPEGKLRCEKCFEFNLKQTNNFAKDFDYFTTTLTISPHKDSTKIFKVGKTTSNKFLEINFKKQDGFKHSIELSNKHNLYRQDYCGCEFNGN
jgi:epoxyqueuosine reductase